MSTGRGAGGGRQARDKMLSAATSEAGGVISTLVGPGPGGTETAPRPAALPRPDTRVLVIDDEPGVRDVIATTLGREGYLVTTCANGREAVARFDAEAFDVVVTDLGMRGLTGWDVAAHVKANRPATPVVLVTGWGDRFTAEEVHSRGVDFLVSKPFSLDQIRAVVRRALTV
ncbi:MAG: response regulator [Candidatus Rokuibacteriota bacterium]